MFPKYFRLSDGAIFRGANNEIINTMTSYMHLYKGEKEEQVVGLRKKKRILPKVSEIIGRKRNTGFSECGDSIQSSSFLRKAC